MMIDLRDLITNPATGKLSKTDFFSCLAYTVATGMFIWKNLTEPTNVELWMTYLLVVGGHNVANKALAYWRDKNVGTGGKAE